MLSVDQIVTLISPVKELAGHEAWRAALARLGSEAAVDDAAEPTEVSATVPPDLSDKKQWLTVKDAAARARVHYQTMLAWIASGRVRSVKSGRHTFIDATTLPIAAIEH